VELAIQNHSVKRAGSTNNCPFLPSGRLALLRLKIEEPPDECENLEGI